MGIADTIYDESSYFISNGIENATDLIIYNWNTIAFTPSESEGYWRLQEKSNDDAIAYESSGVDIVQYGTVGYDDGPFWGSRTGFANGNPGTAFTKYTGNNGTGLDCASPAAFFIECWFKLPIGAVGQQRLIGKANSGSTDGWSILLDSSEKMSLRVGSASITSSTADEYCDGNWHYAVGYREGTGADETAFYIDNVLIGETTSSSTNSSHGFCIGGHNNSTSDVDLIAEACTGWIADVQITEQSVVPATRAAAAIIIANRWNGGIGRIYK